MTVKTYCTHAGKHTDTHANDQITKTERTLPSLIIRRKEMWNYIDRMCDTYILGARERVQLQSVDISNKRNSLRCIVVSFAQRCCRRQRKMEPAQPAVYNFVVPLFRK